MTHFQHKLDFWFRHHFNVLLVGKHGIGKTSLVKQCFERNGLSLTGDRKYIYFSASTMDPWTDLVGLPEKVKGDDNKYYLDFVRPKRLEEVEAIFLDELNRPSSSKTMNALMELILNKSINGHPFPNLKIIWAAINPPDSDLNYQIEELDPTQLDRFQIHHTLPYRPDSQYFINKFGQRKAEMAINWWFELSEAEKNLVSPRRLDYALELFNLGGDLHDVLSEKVNVAKLTSDLNSSPEDITIHKLFILKNSEENVKFFTNENNFKNNINELIKNKKYYEYFFEFFSQEKQMMLMHDFIIFRKIVASNVKKYLELSALFVNQYPKHNWSIKIKKQILNKFHYHLHCTWEQLAIIIRSDWMRCPSKNLAQRKAKFKLLKDNFPLVFQTNSNEFNILKHILNNDINSKIKNKKEFLELEKMINIVNYVS